MRHSSSLNAAENIGKWKILFEIFWPFILAYFYFISPAELRRPNLACLSNPCIYGICIDEVNGTFSCYCIDGYTGFLCQTNWDECWSNPCLNGGVCIDGIAQYNCSCPPGYQGELCEQDINECESNPCHNNGTCIDGPNGYTCVCPSGYLGSFCETDISVCNDTHETRCLNGGFCIEGPGFTFNCLCTLGWEGQFCEDSVDECISSPCLNGAACLDLQANYTCVCPFGFSGRNCEVELEMCGDTSPCQNGALCLVEDWLRICYCVPDFHGDRCQFQYNECLLGPGCLNGGTCIDGVDGYDCSCPPGWSGNFCECLILSEEDVDCSYPLPPRFTDLTPVPTVPIWVENIVPKTKSFTKATTPNYYFSLLTECIPIWPKHTTKTYLTTKGITTHTQKTVPFNWFTKKVFPTVETQDTKTTKTLKTNVPIFRATQTSMSSGKNATPTALMTPLPTITTTPTATKTTSKMITLPSTEGAATKKKVVTTEITPMTTTFTTKITAFLFSTTSTEKTIIPVLINKTEFTPLSRATNTPETTTMSTTTSESTKMLTEMTTVESVTMPTTTTIRDNITMASTITTNTTTRTMHPSVTFFKSTTTKTTAEMTPPTSKTSRITSLSDIFIQSITTPIFKKVTTSPQTTPTTTTETISTKLSVMTITTESQTIYGNFTMSPFIPTTTRIFSHPNFSEKVTIISNFTQTFIPPTTHIPWNCRKIPCLNGGTCLNTKNGPRCLCKANWEGSFCDAKVDVKIAGFSGKSYVTHKLFNTHNVKIEVVLRTTTSMGVILYSHLGVNIFMILYIENGLLKFKFSCGVQTMLLSEVQFPINNSFDLMASVSLDFFPPTKNPIHCKAAVRINNTLAMSGEQLARGSHADPESVWVYLGGVPSHYVNEELPVLKGFVGCMKNFKINNKPRGIFNDSFDSHDITECKSLACLSSPCGSGSSCIERNNSWACLCPSGFLGRTCEKSVCSNNPCQFGGTCASFPGSGFICLCPMGKQGIFCEEDLLMGYPLFASSISGYSSFAAYKLPTEIYQDMLLNFKFLPHDMEQISLMVFIGQDGPHGATSDHLAVSFIKGYVVLTWNLGSGPRRIFTAKPVQNTGQYFHTVKIGRAGQRAWLTVDNQQNVTGKSPGKLSQLNTKPMVYLGGHDSRNFSLLPHDLPLHTGFSGCLFDVELKTGQMLIKIDKTSPISSRGVGQCGKSLCNEHSCKNGGGCINHGATFTCLCSEGWFGPVCSMKYNPCDTTRQNCSEGSTCVPLKQGFFCDCPVGKTGKYCEINEELSDVKFKGIRSYIALMIEGLHQFQSCIDLEIYLEDNNGLILYSGRLERNSFWSLSLQDNVLELRVSPGVNRRRREVLVIRNRRLLGLRKWHRIRAGRYGRKLFLWVEGTVHTGILQPDESLPPLGTTVYIGGVPDLSKIPVGVSGKILKPFKGCIRKFKSQAKTIFLTKDNILEGRNVEDCDGSVCGGDVCENGGTCHIGAHNEPVCTCLKQYKGHKCEYRLSCKEIQCQNNGRCIEMPKLSPQCHCPNGWGGPFCESDILVKAPHFQGNSYILVESTDSSTTKRNIQNEFIINFIYLNFTTAKSNGMLLWSSKNSDTEFIGIGVENGKMKFVWAWAKGNTTVLTLEEQIADGGWHELSISFNSSEARILMDGQTVYESNESHFGYPLSTDGKFFLGGFPETNTILEETLGHFDSGFDGCLEKLSWGSQMEILNFSNFRGENIRSCDSFDL